jgi:hypothetical protein
VLADTPLADAFFLVTGTEFDEATLTPQPVQKRTIHAVYRHFRFLKFQFQIQFFNPCI